MTCLSVRTFAVQTMSVLRPIGASRRSAEVTSFLTEKGSPSSSRPSFSAARDLELLELLDDVDDLLADRLQRSRHAEAEVLEPDVAQALLAEGRAGAVPHELVREHPRDVVEGEAVARVLEHAAVQAAQQVLEVLALVLAHARDVRV